MHDAIDQSPGLSPAARSLLKELDGDDRALPANGPSVLELRGRRLEPILAELVEKDLAVISDRGHVTTMQSLARLAGWMREHCGEEPCSLDSIAASWDVSKGRCKALLSALVRDGVIQKLEAGYLCA
jgi:hypothetical protein